MSLLPPSLWLALGLTLKLAFVTTTVLLVVGLPLAMWLHCRRGKVGVMLQALITLPLVLPPTVIGFYLLILFAPHHFLGAWWLQWSGHTLAFSFTGLVMGSVLYSLPFAVQPFLSGLKSVSVDYLEAARTQGANRWQVFRYVTWPLASRGILVGVMLSFAHTVGEFGVVLMLGGGIPGETKVASIALYDEVQKINYPAAHALALMLVLISLVFMVMLILWQRELTEHTD
jgi:molybdate transport system permease protein